MLGHGDLVALSGLIEQFVPVAGRCLKDGLGSAESVWAAKAVFGVVAAVMHVFAVAGQRGPVVSVAAGLWAAAVAAVAEVAQHGQAIQHEPAAVGPQAGCQHEAAGVGEVAARSAGQIGPDAGDEAGPFASAASAAFAACAVAELGRADIGLDVGQAEQVEQQVSRNSASASWPRPLPSSSSSSRARLDAVPGSRTASREQLVWA